MLRLTETDLEVLRALHALRYLTVEQIQKQWFSERGEKACASRTSRLCSGGVLVREPVNHGGYRSALRLSVKGLRQLCEVRSESLAAYEPLSALYLPHLLDTNEVFLALAGPEWRWDALPFLWRGSHRSLMRFVDRTRAAHGGAQRRRRLVPDAIVTPLRGAVGPRCFLELDRSTEAIQPRPGRTSIRGKLRAYRALLVENAPGRDKTPYELLFARSPRLARVVFVVSSRDPAQRRAASILGEARAALPKIDVRCIALADTVGLRGALLPPAAARPTLPENMPAPASFAELTYTSADKLRHFYVAAVRVLREAHFEDATERERVRLLARDAHGVLRRIAHTLSLRQESESQT